MKSKKYCFVIVRRIPYEGDSLIGIFSDESDADEKAMELNKRNDMKGVWDYLVEEWVLQ